MMYRINCAVYSCVRVALTASALFAATLPLSGSARSFEFIQPPVAVSVTGNPSSSSSPTSRSMADSCLPLLKTVRQESPVSAMDRHRSADPASQAAAIGLVLGVRFALGPKEVLKHGHRPRASVGLQLLQSGNAANPQALAVADYRRCRNEAALQALSEEWRWKR